MKRVLLTFLLQSIPVVVLAVPVFFYLRADYRDYKEKQAIAQNFSPNAGALCSDGWESPSVGSGTCSHHSGVRFWGSYLRHVATTTWENENTGTLVFWLLVLVGWYGYGIYFVKTRYENEIKESYAATPKCCRTSEIEGHVFCYGCGRKIMDRTLEKRTPLLAGSAYGLVSLIMFGLVGSSIYLAVYGAGHMQTPSANTTLVATPTPIPSPKPDTLVNDDPIFGGKYLNDESRIYRFHLTKPAHVQGSFSANGTISVVIRGRYSSNGAVSADTFHVDLPPGDYELVLTAQNVVTAHIKVLASY